MKKNKYLKKSLESLGLKLSDSTVLDTEKDLDFAISEYKQMRIEAESQILELKDCIIKLDENLNILESLKHQIKVEQLKELNPGLKIF